VRSRKKREAARRREEREERRAERAAARVRAREQQALQEDVPVDEVVESPLPELVDDELIDEPIAPASRGRFEYISETVYTSFEPLEPCGFTFDNVIAGFRTRARRGSGDGEGETPTVGSEPRTVYAQGRNFEKIKADILPMMPLFVALSEPRAELVYKAVFPDLPRMLAQIRPFGEKEDAIKGIENVPVITVEDDENAKRVGAFPVKVRIVMLNRDVRLETRSNSAINAAQAASSVPSLGPDASPSPAGPSAGLPDSLVLDMWYEPGGLALRGRVVAWKSKNGYQCEFALGRVSGDYIPTALRVTSTPGTWRTVFE